MVVLSQSFGKQDVRVAQEDIDPQAKRVFQQIVTDIKCENLLEKSSKTVKTKSNKTAEDGI